MTNKLHFLGLEHLPIELQRNFTLLRDLDARAQNLMKSIDKLATDYLEGIAFASKSSGDKRKELMSNIQKMFNKAKEYGDDKVQLAIQTYELVSRQSPTTGLVSFYFLQVDKHIRRLDSDLARFEAEIQEKAAASSARSVEETPGNKSKSRFHNQLGPFKTQPLVTLHFKIKNQNVDANIISKNIIFWFGCVCVLKISNVI